MSIRQFLSEIYKALRARVSIRIVELLALPLITAVVTELFGIMTTLYLIAALFAVLALRYLISLLR